MLAQSGRFRGLCFNISSCSCCPSFSGGRSFRIVLLGGGGGGLGGGGGGIAALDELFDNVGAPIYTKILFLLWPSGIANLCVCVCVCVIFLCLIGDRYCEKKKKGNWFELFIVSKIR